MVFSGRMWVTLRNRRKVRLVFALPIYTMKMGRRHSTSCSQLLAAFLLCMLAGYLLTGMWQQQQQQQLQQHQVKLSYISTTTQQQQQQQLVSAAGAETAAAAAAVSFDESDTFEPIIRAPPNLTLTGRKPARPRFYSTELGTRRRLYVAVLSSVGTVASGGHGINHTLASIVADIGFFMIGEPAPAHVETLKEVVTFPAHQDVNLPLATADYIASHYGNLYDYYYLVSDSTYVRGHRLLQLVKQLSVSVDTFMSAAAKPQQEPQQQQQAGTAVCGVESGLLLSRLVLNAVLGRTDQCRSLYSAQLAAASPSPSPSASTSQTDVALVACLERFSAQQCSNTAQGNVYVSYSVSELDGAAERQQQQLQQQLPSSELLTVRGVQNAGQFRQLHVATANTELQQLSVRVQQLRAALRANRRNLRALLVSSSAAAAAGAAGGGGGDVAVADDSGSAGSSGSAAAPAPPAAAAGLEELLADEPVWPLGSAAPIRTTSRHHINLWQRFTRTHVYLPTPDLVIRPLTRNELEDVQDVVELAMAEVCRAGGGRRYRLVDVQSAHRRFDGGRGMDYVLDLLVTQAAHSSNDTSSTSSSGSGASSSRHRPATVKRVEVHRPIMKAELVPMPFVTEKPTVSVVLPVLVSQVERAQEFVDTVMSNNENLAIVLVLLAADQSLEPFRPLIQTVRLFNNRTATGAAAAGGGGARMGWVTVTGVGGTMPSHFFLMDVASRKLSERALVLLLLNGPALEYVSEMFNRVRMQTIRGWEVFAPIPWIEYHPDLIYSGGVRQRQQLTVHKDYGLFDADFYGIISFYVDDYKQMRAAMSPGGGLMRATDLVADRAALYDCDMYGAFVRHSSLHVHRAVDPSFRLYYFTRTCAARPVWRHQHACVSSLLDGVGSQTQLARAIAEFRDWHSSNNSSSSGSGSGSDGSSSGRVVA